MGTIGDDSKEDIEQGTIHGPSVPSSTDIVLRPELTGDQLGPLASKGNEAGTAAAECKLAPAASSSSDDLHASSANHIQSYISTHYNVGNDVVLRLEFIRDRQMKRALIGIWVVESLAFIALIAEVSLKLSKTSEWFFRRRVVEKTNVFFATVCLVVLTISLGILSHRLALANASGKRWSHRRIRTARKAVVEHTIVLVIVLSWFIANVYVVAGPCRWFDGFVIVNGTIQWSGWNAIFALFLMYAHDSNPWVRRTGLKGWRPDSVIMDAPRVYHWDKFLVFCAVEGLLIAIGVLSYRGGVNVPEALRKAGCQTLSYQCSISTAVTVLVALVTASFIAYFLGVLYCYRRAYAMLRAKPYNTMRMANLHIRLQSRLRGVAMGFFVLCLILFVYVAYGNCKAYLQSWLGFLPMNIVMTGIACINSFLAMPSKGRSDQGTMQVWLQEFAWSEADLPARREERRSGVCDANGDSPMDLQPMFCFETSLKALFWAILVYRHAEAKDDGGVNLEAGMSLYGLKHFELLWNRKVDTKCLMAWNDNLVVLSFRGTASMRNVLADIKAWYAVHPPKRGRPWALTRPYVHQGFLRAWRDSGLCDRVVDRIRELVAALEHKGGNVRVLVTGHSLGGALATLAAFDIQEACKTLPQMSLSVYTFGAPRVGNHAFARECWDKIPELWNVINDQDTVPRAAKFLFLYKRPGHRVLINSDGDMIVRPSYVESSVQKRTTSSVAHHLLASYQRAHIAIIKAQFTSKRLANGMSGVLAVAQACGMQGLLKAAGIAYKDASRLERLGSAGGQLLDTATPAAAKRTMQKLSSGLSSLSCGGCGGCGVLHDPSASGSQGESHAAEEAHDVEKGGGGTATAAAATRDANAIAALADDAAHSPSEAQAEAELATGGDVDVDDGQHELVGGRGGGGGGGGGDGSGDPGSSDDRSDRGRDADDGLHSYVGELVAGQCRYTHVDGISTPSRRSIEDRRQ